MFKENIATAVKTKYQRFGLTNEAIDRIASAREKTVTSEDDVEAAVADAETMGLIANELQKMRDAEIQKRTDTQRAFDAYKEKNPAPKPGGEPDPAKEPPKEMPEPEWAKSLRERFEREDREKADKIVRDAVTARLKMEGCTNPGILKSTMKGFTLGKDETEDNAVTRLKAEYNAYYKEVFGEGAVPGLGGQAFADAKSATAHKNDFLRQQGLLPKQDK
jgi:hypothetical protein